MKIFKLRTWILTFILLGISFLTIRLITPSYPPINKNQSVSEVKKYIQYILKKEQRNISFHYVDSHIPVEQIKALEDYLKDLSSCKNNKKCLIDRYDKFMSEYSSDVMTKTTRAYYMLDKFGIIGEKINQFLGFMY